METQRECWEALLAGKTLVRGYSKYRFGEDHMEISVDEEPYIPSVQSFSLPDEYEVKVEVPLVNPARIPLGWWVAMEESGKWYAYRYEPEIQNSCWFVKLPEDNRFCLSHDIKIEFHGKYTESKFNLERIANRWGERGKR